MDSDKAAKVSSFHSKQELLSILRDDNIMNSDNILFKNNSDDNPEFGSDKLKYIHDSECYKSAYHNYNNKYGYDRNRVIHMWRDVCY